MKLKLKTLIFFLITNCNRITKANNSFNFSGCISDKTTLEPIPEAAVIIFNDRELIAERITDNKGNYKFENLSPNCKYSLKVIKSGYNYFQCEKEIFCNNTQQNIDIELIKIQI